MANRGMLPKFRPATLGGRDGVRPMIRPVGKPTAPPPPPSPPRRISSGIRHPHGPAIEGHVDVSTPSFADPPTMAAARQRIHEIARELPREHDHMEPRYDDETQARPVDDDRNAYQHGDVIPRSYPAPMDAPYESLPSLEAHQPYDRFPAPVENEYEPPSYGRGDRFDRFEAAEPSTQGSPRGAYEQDNDFYGRGGRDAREDSFSEAPVAQQQPQAYRTAAYPPAPNNDEESGPRQRPRKNAEAVPQYDAAAYEANYGRREGSFQRRQQKPSEDSFVPSTHAPPARAAREERGSYQAPRRDEPSYEPPQQHPSYQRARKESGDRRISERNNNNGGSWSAPPQTEIPQAPRVAQDMKVPANFVMGVQPLRTPGSGAAAAMPGYGQVEAFPQVMQQPMQPMRTPMMGIPYGAPGTMAASPRAMHAQPMHQQPMHHQYPQHQHQPHMHVRPATTNAPVGHQLQMTEVEEAQQGSKVGRFAWFVFGAAFGIFFAFFATGFVPRIGKKEEITFPNPPALPAQQQAPVAVAPPPVQQPAPPPVVAAPAPLPVQQQPAFAPQAPAPVAKAPATPPPPAFAAAAPPPPFGVVAASTPAPPPTQKAAAPAPAPRGQRAGTIARRPAPAPKAPANANANNGDDDAPAPAPKASKAEKSSGSDGIGDLLNAGLAP